MICSMLHIAYYMDKIHTYIHTYIHECTHTYMLVPTGLRILAASIRGELVGIHLYQNAKAKWQSSSTSIVCAVKPGESRVRDLLMNR